MPLVDRAANPDVSDAEYAIMERVAPFTMTSVERQLALRGDAAKTVAPGDNDADRRRGGGRAARRDEDEWEDRGRKVAPGVGAVFQVADGGLAPQQCA